MLLKGPKKTLYLDLDNLLTKTLLLFVSFLILNINALAESLKYKSATFII